MSIKLHPLTRLCFSRLIIAYAVREQGEGLKVSRWIFIMKWKRGTTSGTKTANFSAIPRRTGLAYQSLFLAIPSLVLSGSSRYKYSTWLVPQDFHLSSSFLSFLSSPLCTVFLYCERFHRRLSILLQPLTSLDRDRERIVNLLRFFFFNSHRLSLKTFLQHVGPKSRGPWNACSDSSSKTKTRMLN